MQLYLKDTFPGFAPAKIMGSTTQETIEERKKAIVTFLNFVLKNSVLCKARVFQAFFDVGLGLIVTRVLGRQGKVAGRLAFWTSGALQGGGGSDRRSIFGPGEARRNRPRLTLASRECKYHKLYTVDRSLSIGSYRFILTAERCLIACNVQMTTEVIYQDLNPDNNEGPLEIESVCVNCKENVRSRPETWSLSGDHQASLYSDPLLQASHPDVLLLRPLRLQEQRAPERRTGAGQSGFI